MNKYNAPVDANGLLWYFEDSYFVPDPKDASNECICKVHSIKQIKVTNSPDNCFLMDENNNWYQANKCFHITFSNFMPKDSVDHPSHYTDGNIECIDAIQSVLGDEKFKAFCRGNALKYLWRAGKKEGEPAEKDLEKAKWYIKKEISVGKKNK
jgi:hypothetical protein